MKIFRILIFFSSLLFIGCEALEEQAEDEELVVEEQEPCQNVETTVEAGMIMHLPITSNTVTNTIDPEIFAINNGGQITDDRFGAPLEAVNLDRNEEQYIEIVNPITESLRSFTISFWMKNFHLSSVEGYIMSLRGDSRFDIIVDSEKIEFRTKHRRSGYISRQTKRSAIENPSDIYGEWAHIVFRYTHRDRADAFVNGVPRATTDLSDEWYDYDEPSGGSGFGCDNTYSTPANFWSGELDDIRIYERALCVDEIKYLADQ